MNVEKNKIFSTKPEKVTLETNSDYELIITKAIKSAYELCFNKTLDTDVIHVIWFFKALQNFRAIVFLEIDGIREYCCDCIYDGDNEKIYVNFYKKEKDMALDILQYNSVKII